MQKFYIFLALILSAANGLSAGRQLTGVYAPTASPGLPPAEAQKRFTVPEGFEVRLFASEPEVINPVAMTWDARGRLWVLELYEYPLGAAAGTKPRDRIKILEDTDGDGRADKVTIFADGLNLATGMALGNGGVYVGQAPDLLFLRDTNHDDVADTREVLLTGFGLDDRHELLNGFSWGPDGWLYFTHGVFTHSKVRIPEASAPGVEVTAAVARLDPRTKKVEVFADGTSNPWGVDFDREGNAFVSACVIDHLFHMAPGGIYARQGGTPANPYAYELLPSIVQHKHHMAAYCGICIYQGDQFPKEYQGRALMGNIHQNAINHDRLTPNGSSFKAEAEKDFLTTTDGWFRPVSEQVGPDGALWIADWCDKYPCYQNAQADPEGVDRERGRIWRVVYTGNKIGTPVPSRPNHNMDLEKASENELLRFLEDPNEWQRRMAQRLLIERMRQRPDSVPMQQVAKLLEKMLKAGKTLEGRLAALWTLHGAGVLSQDLSLQCETDREPAMRAWGLRLAADNSAQRADRLTPPLLEALTSAASDQNASVRLAAATAVRRLVSSSLTVDTDLNPELPIGKVLNALAKASSDAKDPLIPFMIWMAGEPALAAHPSGGLTWLAETGPSTMPLSGMLARKAMRRICDTQDKEKLALTVDFLLQLVSMSADKKVVAIKAIREVRGEIGIAEALRMVEARNNALAVAALDGMIEGQKAKPMPPETDTGPLFSKLQASSDSQVRERGQELGTLWGNAAAIRSTLVAITNSALPLEQRLKAIGAAKMLKNAAARTALLKAIEPRNPTPLIVEAIRALGEIGGDEVSNDLLRVWKMLAGEGKSAAAEVLVSRRRWAIALLSAVEVKTIPASDIPLTAVRSLGESRDEFIRQRASQAIGRIRPANADKQAIIAQKKKMILESGPGDAEAGHELAKKTCFVCHKLYGEGADVGPDLTGVGRSSLDALLANVIDPNQVVGKGYENVMIETKDGRSVSGRLAENTDTQVKLLSAGPKQEVIAKADIASQRVSELSVMPEGLEQMPESDFRNLILYILHPPQERAGR